MISKKNRFNTYKNSDKITSQRLNVLSDLLNLRNVDASKLYSQQSFYKLGFAYIDKILRRLHVNFTIGAAQTLFDGIIKTEEMLFAKSRILNFIVKFLINNSDGTNLQCIFYTQILNSLLDKYNINLTV